MLAPGTTAGNAPYTVNFDATGSSDSDGTIVRYDYDFNNDDIWDAYDASSTVSWTYTAFGNYTAKLRVTDNLGAQSTTTSTIAVNAVPIASLVPNPTGGTAPMIVTYDASASYDPNGTIIDYEWDINNNGVFNEAGAEAAARGMTSVQVTYNSAGSYTVVVRVTDNATPPGIATASATIIMHGWLFMTIPTSANGGYYTSLSVINGNPAITYWDNIAMDLMYVRATDADGINWGTPLTLVSSGDQGHFPRLITIAGNPAITYYNNTGRALMYIRATDVNGSTWDAPITIGGNGYYPSMAVVNGTPAVTYYDYTSYKQMYVRAVDATGAAWNTPIVVDATTFAGQYPALIVVDGYPAISYYSEGLGDLSYIRALDASGTSWARRSR